MNHQGGTTETPGFEPHFSSSLVVLERAGRCQNEGEPRCCYLREFRGFEQCDRGFSNHRVGPERHRVACPTQNPSLWTSGFKLQVSTPEIHIATRHAVHERRQVKSGCIRDRSDGGRVDRWKRHKSNGRAQICSTQSFIHSSFLVPDKSPTRAGCNEPARSAYDPDIRLRRCRSS